MDCPRRFRVHRSRCHSAACDNRHPKNESPESFVKPAQFTLNWLFRRGNGSKRLPIPTLDRQKKRAIEEREEHLLLFERHRHRQML
uniref:C3H1-type domain-containing protein n=1 Tax=Panagrellus redivivus TaxID=6233 RepID=A0A7E4UT65_PANRE